MIFEFTSRAKKSLKKLDKSISCRIADKLLHWQTTDNPLAFAKKIEGYSNFYRFRVGDWRIIVYHNQGKHTLEIANIGHRNNIYEALSDL